MTELLGNIISLIFTNMSKHKHFSICCYHSVLTLETLFPVKTNCLHCKVLIFLNSTTTNIFWSPNHRTNLGNRFETGRIPFPLWMKQGHMRVISPKQRALPLAPLFLLAAETEKVISSLFIPYTVLPLATSHHQIDFTLHMAKILPFPALHVEINHGNVPCNWKEN